MSRDEPSQASDALTYRLISTERYLSYFNILDNLFNTMKLLGNASDLRRRHKMCVEFLLKKFSG